MTQVIAQRKNKNLIFAAIMAANATMRKQSIIKSFMPRIKTAADVTRIAKAADKRERKAQKRLYNQASCKMANYHNH